MSILVQVESTNLCILLIVCYFIFSFVLKSYWQAAEVFLQIYISLNLYETKIVEWSSWIHKILKLLRKINIFCLALVVFVTRRYDKSNMIVLMMFGNIETILSSSKD
jgi:hypothetical protein